MSYAIPGAWAEHGACVGATARMEMPTTAPTGTRGPAQRARHQIDAARTICQSCPVLDQCRTWALTDPDPAAYMIAGGLTPRERDALRSPGCDRTAPFAHLVELIDACAPIHRTEAT